MPCRSAAPRGAHRPAVARGALYTALERLEAKAACVADGRPHRRARRQAAALLLVTPAGLARSRRPTARSPPDARASRRCSNSHDATAAAGSPNGSSRSPSATTAGATSILGDLREEFQGVRRQRGPSAARGGGTGGTRWRSASRSLRSAAAAAAPRGGWSAETHGGGGAPGSARDVRMRGALVRRPGTSAVVIVDPGAGARRQQHDFAMLDALVLRPYRFPGSIAWSSRRRAIRSRDCSIANR